MGLRVNMDNKVNRIDETWQYIRREFVYLLGREIRDEEIIAVVVVVSAMKKYISDTSA